MMERDGVQKNGKGEIMCEGKGWSMENEKGQIMYDGKGWSIEKWKGGSNV